MSSDIVCPSCKGSSQLHFKDIKSIYNEKIYQIYRCQECELGFTYPFGIDQEFYSDDEYGYERYKAQEFEAKWRSKYYHKIIKKYAKSRVLDIGCMFGFLLKTLKPLYTVQGIELGKTPCRELNEINIPCYNGTIESFSESENMRFDFIVSTHVLEHTEDPKSFLDAAHQVLDDDGHLMLIVPNFDNTSIFKKHWGWILVPAHLLHFNLNSLNKILRESNFDPVEVKFKGGYAAFYLTKIYSFLGLSGGKEANINVVKLVYRIFFYFLAMPLFYFRKDELIVVSKKS